MNYKSFINIIIIALCFILSGCKGECVLQQNAEGVSVVITDSCQTDRNLMFTDIMQVADGNVSFYELIEGASTSRRLVMLISGLVLLIFIVRLGYCLWVKEQRSIRLRLFAAITLVCGWSLYYVGFFIKGTATSFLAFFVRPLLASFGMFVGSSGYQEISEECANSSSYMSAFAIIHLAAITISAIFVVNFFWKRLKSYLLGIHWRFSPTSTPLNIFFGFNEQSIFLAKDISKDGERHEHIIFIDLPTDEDQQNNELSLSRLLGFSSFQQANLEQLKGIRYVLKSSLGRLSEIEAKDGEVLKALHLSAIKSLIQRFQHTRIFFLSNDEDENIKSVLNLMQDRACKNNKLDIYCHARKNKVNSVVEKMAYVTQEGSHPNVHLIDSANLSILLLKKNVNYQPISFVKSNTEKGTVEDAFYALILGFGETGRDAVRFLYEFGAFPDSNGKKSPFKCYVIDKQMDKLSGSFYNNTPALKGNKEIELLKMDDKSNVFWDWIDSHILQLNYVVLALGNDKLNMQIAVDLLEKALRANKDMKNFKIFIRSYVKDYEKRMKEMTDFYNKKVGPVFAIFGTGQEIYTYRNVIDDEAMQQAKAFYFGYKSKKKDDPTWEERHIISEKIESSGQIVFQVKDRKKVTLDEINAVIRKENQDLANSYHVDTKLALVGLTRESLEQDFANLNDEQKKNLAICEHLRWNASHEMIGYVYGEKDDNLRKTHSCLKPWQELSEEYKGYDYQVMERTKDVVLNRQK